MTHHSLDVGGIAVILLSAGGYIPAFAAVLSLIYFAMQIITWVVNKGWKRKP